DAPRLTLRLRGREWGSRPRRHLEDAIEVGRRLEGEIALAPRAHEVIGLQFRVPVLLDLPALQGREGGQHGAGGGGLCRVLRPAGRRRTNLAPSSTWVSVASATKAGCTFNSGLLRQKPVAPQLE